MKLLNFIDMLSMVYKHQTDNSFMKQAIATQMEIFV